MMLVNKRYKEASGLEIVIGGARDEHIPSLLDFFRETENEGVPFVGSGCKTKELTEKCVCDWLHEAQFDPDRLYLICRVGGQVAGIADIQFYNDQRIWHRAVISMSVRSEYRNRGIGTQFMELLFASARERRGVSQLELSIYEGNKSAMKLCENFGFHITSVIPRAFRHDGCFFTSELRMSRLL